MLGAISTAVAAAANLLLSPHTHAMFSVAGDSPCEYCADEPGSPEGDQLWRVTSFDTVHACSAPWRMSALLGCAGMLAADGRCKTLDAAAEGYVRAEAVGAVWLRCLTSVAGLTLGPKRPVSTASSSASSCLQQTNIPCSTHIR